MTRFTPVFLGVLISFGCCVKARPIAPDGKGIAVVAPGTAPFSPDPDIIEHDPALKSMLSRTDIVLSYTPELSALVTHRVNVLHLNVPEYSVSVLDPDVLVERFQKYSNIIDTEPNGYIDRGIRDDVWVRQGQFRRVFRVIGHELCHAAFEYDHMGDRWKNVAERELADELFAMTCSAIWLPETRNPEIGYQVYLEPLKKTHAVKRTPVSKSTPPNPAPSWTLVTITAMNTLVCTSDSEDWLDAHLALLDALQNSFTSANELIAYAEGRVSAQETCGEKSLEAFKTIWKEYYKVRSSEFK